MSSTEYSPCSVCDRSFQLTAKGNVRPHAVEPTKRKDPRVWERCRGSMEPPRRSVFA